MELKTRNPEKCLTKNVVLAAIVNVWPPETVEDGNTSICQTSHGFLPSAAKCGINARNTAQNKRTRFPLRTRAHQPHDP